MEQFQHRSTARIVAIIHLIFLCLFLILVGFLFVGVIAITFAGASGGTVPPSSTVSPGGSTTEEPPAKKEVTKYTVFAGWFALLWSSALVVLEFIAAVKLYKATAIDVQDLEKALSQCRFWRTVVLVFTIIGIISYILSFQWIRLVVTILINGIFLYIVKRYIDELEVATGSIPKV